MLFREKLHIIDSHKFYDKNILYFDYLKLWIEKVKNNGLRHIRFHDLRHSCASLLLSKNIPMKAIQEWLGHSDFSTTANIYAHLDINSKLLSAKAISSAFSFKD